MPVADLPGLKKGKGQVLSGSRQFFDSSILPASSAFVATHAPGKQCTWLSTSMLPRLLGSIPNPLNAFAAAASGLSLPGAFLSGSSTAALMAAARAAGIRWRVSRASLVLQARILAVISLLSGKFCGFLFVRSLFIGCLHLLYGSSLFPILFPHRFPTASDSFRR